MKVVHLITSLDSGGAEGALYRYVTSDKEFEHIVISLRDFGVFGEKLRESGINVYALNFHKGPFKAVREMIKILKDESPCLIQTWMYHADLIGGLVGKILGYKVVWGLRNTELNLATSKLSTLLVAKICAWLSYFIPSRIISCANAAKISHQAYGYNDEIIKVVANGYFVEEVEEQAVRKDLSLADDTFLIGMVARFDPFKDHQCLLDALYDLSKSQTKVKWFCVLVGNKITNENSILVNWIKDRGLTKNIALLGPSTKVRQIMKALDLHVLSSNSEAFPNVLAEAMSVSTPCLSTDVGDASLIIGDTGMIVPAKNPAALSKGMMYFMSLSKKERQNLGARAKLRIIEKYSQEVQCAKFAEIYREVLN